MFRVLISILLLVVYASGIKPRKSGYHLHYGLKFNFRIPEMQLMQLQNKYPANLDIVLRRKDKGYDKYTKPWNLKCTDRPYIAFAPDTYE